MIVSVTVKLPIMFWLPVKLKDPVIEVEPLITWFPINVFEPVVAKVPFEFFWEAVNDNMLALNAFTDAVVFKILELNALKDAVNEFNDAVFASKDELK